MTITISHNEIIVACIKAFEALGLPLGQREDAAEAVGWLALHGLPFEDQLSTALHSFNSRMTIATPISQSEHESVWDAQGGSAVHIFPNLADFAAAQACKHQSHQLTVRNLTDFGIMWPYLAKIHGRNLAFELVWKNGPDTVIQVSGAAGAPLPDVTWAMGQDDDQVGEVVLTVSQQGVEKRSQQGQLIRVDTHQVLHSNAQHRLKAGIEINQSLWDQLKELGTGILVEATEESEMRGAGGV